MNTGEVINRKASDNLKITNLVGLGQGARNNPSLIGTGAGDRVSDRVNRAQSNPTKPFSNTQQKQTPFAPSASNNSNNFTVSGIERILNKPPKPTSIPTTIPKNKPGNQRLSENSKLKPLVIEAYQHRESVDLQNLSNFFLQDEPLLEELSQDEPLLEELSQDERRFVKKKVQKKKKATQKQLETFVRRLKLFTRLRSSAPFHQLVTNTFFYFKHIRDNESKLFPSLSLISEQNEIDSNPNNYLDLIKQLGLLLPLQKKHKDYLKKQNKMLQ